MSDLLGSSSTDDTIVIHEGGATVFGPVGLPVPSTLRLDPETALDGATRSAHRPDGSRAMRTAARGTWSVAAGATLAAAR